MNGSGAKRLALTSLSVTGVLTVVDAVRRGQSPDVPRVLIGAMVAGAVLTFGADYLPDLVGAFAVLILLGAVIGYGPGLWGAVTSRTRTGVTAGSATDGSTFNRPTGH